ncbi:carbonic anhydrase [Rothia sp. LK2588]|uniref:carbonic anhydrase n=1 Tax=Rothia sp. LK2588 TaxID=3114369 RepID=UPI0034CD1A5D
MTNQLTPAQALEFLLEGNKRFTANSPTHPNQDSVRRADLAQNGQNPFATLFGCGDSRLAAEVIFDQGLGDLFVVRTAGHASGPAVLGSLEFGVSGLNTPLVVVLGHDSCGAVTATKNSLDSGVLPGGFQRNFIEDILPSALSSQLPDNPTVNDMVREHTRFTCERIIEQSRVISEAVAANQTAVVGMFYHLAEGSAEIVWSTDNLK